MNNTKNKSFSRHALTYVARITAIAATLLACTNAMAMDFASPIQPTTGNGGGLGQITIEGVTPVILDPTLLAQLPSKGQFTLLGFPIGKGQTVDLQLEQFHVELADAHAVVSSLDENNEIISTPVFHLGDAAQFRGGIIGDENSKVFLSFSSTANAGIIVTANGATFIMSDGEVDSRGPIVITSMLELPPGVIQWEPFACGVNTSDFMPSKEILDESPDAAIAKAVASCQVAKIYIETDYQTYSKLGSNSTALTNYILQMAGAANSIYYKDMQIDLRLAGWFIYTNDAADGFGIYGDTYSALDAVQSKWQSAPYSGYNRTLVSYLTSQGVGGGRAWLYALCKKDYGFSICGSLAGAFPYPLSLRSSQNWDIMVFCHELGHNFGAYHTHDLGLDNCYTSSGLGSCVASNPNYPPIGGTIMSYCHQCSGGMSNINMIFHYGTVADIAPYVRNNSCFGSCGSMTLTASTNQREKVNLSWTTDPNAVSYTVYRRLPSTINTQNPLDMALPVAILTVTGLSTVDTTIECNKNYEYYVRANYTTSSTSSPTGMMSDIQSGIALCENPSMPCMGDLNQDHAVDSADIGTLLGAFGTCVSGAPGDFNFDAAIDSSDLGTMLGNFGPCPSDLVWATVLQWNPDSDVVTDATVRANIVASGYPWRVLDTGTGIEMLLIPGGTFTMGCSRSNSYVCDGDESPTHQVTLSKAFYLGKTEVTQAQWQAKMSSNPSYFKSYSDSPSRPVEQVSWNDIAGFSTATGLRLPTEAEREYACRGSTTTAFHSMPGYPNGTNDDSLLGNIAWYNTISGSTTHAVAGKAANAFGMYDMSGNVEEWCNDWYGSYNSGNATDPAGPSSGSSRVLRGGSWYYGSSGCRSSNRLYYAPGNRNNTVGFRVARHP